MEPLLLIPALGHLLTDDRNGGTFLAASVARCPDGGASVALTSDGEVVTLGDLYLLPFEARSAPKPGEPDTSIPAPERMEAIGPDVDTAARRLLGRLVELYEPVLAEDVALLEECRTARVGR